MLSDRSDISYTKLSQDTVHGNYDDAEEQAPQNTTIPMEEDSEYQFSSQLEYLSPLNKNEIEALEDQHQLSRYELNQQLIDHRWIYLVYLSENWLSIMSANLPSLLFQLMLSKEGVQIAAKHIYPQVELSHTSGLILSAPPALAKLLFQVSIVSAEKEAAISTLDYANRISYKVKLKDILAETKIRSLETTASAIKWVVNKSIISTHNLIYASTSVLAFNEPINFSLPGIGALKLPALLPQLSGNLQLGLSAVFVYSASHYHALVSQRTYYQHFKEFWVQGFKDLWNNNLNAKPWLLGEFYRGNYATAVEIAIQGFSTVAVGTYPYFYYLAEETFSKLLGLSPSIATALALASTSLEVLHILCITYPEIYQYYLVDQIKIETILKNQLKDQTEDNINQEVDNAVDFLRLAMVPSLIDLHKQYLKDKIMQDFLNTNKKLLQKQTEEAEDSYYPFNRNSTLLPLLVLQAGLGSYLGYYWISPLFNSFTINGPISSTTLGILSGTSILSLTYYQAEKTRITNHYIQKRMDKRINSESKENNEEEVNLSQNNMLSVRAAHTLSTSSKASTVLAILGTGERVFGSNHAAMTATVIFAINNLLTSVSNHAVQLGSSVRSWFCFARKNNQQTVLSKISSTLFHRNEPRPLFSDLGNKRRSEIACKNQP